MFQPLKNLKIWLQCAGPSYLLWHFKSTLNNPALSSDDLPEARQAWLPLPSGGMPCKASRKANTSVLHSTCHSPLGPASSHSYRPPLQSCAQAEPMASLSQHLLRVCASAHGLPASTICPWTCFAVFVTRNKPLFCGTSSHAHDICVPSGLDQSPTAGRQSLAVGAEASEPNMLQGP